MNTAAERTDLSAATHRRSARAQPVVRFDRPQPVARFDAANRRVLAADAANVVRAGRDILYLVSCSGNRLGGEWLQRTLGSEYRVHLLEGIYDGTHIDTTVTLLGPGKVLLNPARIKADALPEVFRNWDILWTPEMVDTGTTWPYARASIWSGMNFFMVNPGLAVVNEAQTLLRRLLAKHGIETIGVPLRHCRTLSGGLHCVTLDVRRRGRLESYT